MSKMMTRAVLALFAIVSVVATGLPDAGPDSAQAAADTPIEAFTLRALPQPKLVRGVAGIAWSLVRVEDFSAELMGLAVLAVAIVLHFIARGKYQAKATAWMQGSVHIWQSNFAQFGDEKNYSLIRDGPYDFIFYASGRRYVKKVYGYIKLATGFDPIGYIFSNPYMAQLHPHIVKSDTVVMDFHISEELPSIFFAIIAKDHYPNIKRKRYDVADFGSLVKPGAITGGATLFPKDHYVVLADAPELAASYPEILETLWATVGLDANGNGTAFPEPLIESIIITDQPKQAELPTTPDGLKSSPKMMHVTFKMPPQSLPADAAASLSARMVQLVMDIVDYYGELRLSAEGINRIRKVRANAEDRIAKKLEEQRKKELKDLKYQAQKKKEEEIGKLSVEEQRKYNERKQKAEMKKRVKSGKILM
ncbi:hypothetical protein HDU82_006256 [Entophlyctis luteolus]|nr:hypothetical protein HDU82_006256 [Entophlyctis luteolus]